MSDRNITLVEYHSHGDGPRLFPNLFDREVSEADEKAGGGAEETDEEGGGRGRGLAMVLALGLMIAMGVGYRYYRSGGESTEFETEQVEVTEYEN